MLEDGLNTLVAVAAQGQGAAASRLQTGIAVRLAQTQNPQAGAVGLLGVLAGHQHGLDEFFGGRPGLRGPVGQPLG